MKTSEQESGEGPHEKPETCSHPLCQTRVSRFVNTAITDGRCLDCHQKKMYFKT